MDAPASPLEAAIADAGLLLVELEKFRLPDQAGREALRREALALGDRARRLNRAGTLDAARASSLSFEATGLVQRLRAALVAVRSGPSYQAALAAHRRGDHGALAALLPEVLEGLEFVPRPPDLFHTPPWLRRNRPRPAAEVVAEVVRMRESGLAAHGDAMAPGTDPDLPAVELSAGPPPGEPLVIRFACTALPPAVFRLRATGQHLVHVPALRAAFSVAVPETLDDEAIGEVSLDPARYRAELLAHLARAGIRVP